jgi:nucleoside-diphosphate-sugar epimerase
VYGPGQKPKGLFDQMITMSSDGSLLGRINWPGRTSIIHVDDIAAIMIDVASLPAAAGEVYCVASDESPTVGEIAVRVGAVIGHPVKSIEIPRSILGLMRTLVWNRAIQRAMPGAARLAFWRLSLIVSNGFWFDTTKFRRLYSKPLRGLEEGLADTIPKM